MFGDLMKLAKSLLLGMIQDYIYDQRRQLIDFLRDKGWVNEAGVITVPADKLDDFAKDCWKAVAHVIRHG